MAKKEKTLKEISLLTANIISDVQKKFPLKKQIHQDRSKKPKKAADNFLALKLNKQEIKEMELSKKKAEREEIEKRKRENDKLRSERLLYVIKTCDKHNISPKHIIQIMDLNKQPSTTNNYNDDNDSDTDF